MQEPARRQQEKLDRVVRCGEVVSVEPDKLTVKVEEGGDDVGQTVTARTTEFTSVQAGTGFRERITKELKQKIQAVREKLNQKANSLPEEGKGMTDAAKRLFKRPDEKVPVHQRFNPLQVGIALFRLARPEAACFAKAVILFSWCRINR